MSFESAIWLGIAAAIVVTLLIVAVGTKKAVDSARDAFENSLTDEQRERLAAHELLGGSWQSFQDLLVAEEAENRTD